MYEDDEDIKDIIAAAKVKAKQSGKSLDNLEIELLSNCAAFDKWWGTNKNDLSSFKFALLDIEIKHEDRAGIDAAARLRQASNSDTLPIVFFTKHNGKKIRTGAYAAGATSYIKKPSGTERKIARLAEILTYWYDRNILSTG